MFSSHATNNFKSQSVTEVNQVIGILCRAMVQNNNEFHHSSSDINRNRLTIKKCKQGYQLQSLIPTTLTTNYLSLDTPYKVHLALLIALTRTSTFKHDFV